MARNQVEELLNARAEIDEQLRRHKNLLTVLFTDIVGSTSYFDRFGDTAGLAMVHLNSELGTNVIGDFGGTIVKTIGDSIMADFPEPKSAVKAAIEMQRRLIELNSELPDHRRMELRIGIHSGMGFRKGADVFGDVVNLAARITKRTEAAQILISHTVQEAIAAESDIACRWLDKCTIDGRNEKEDIFEVIWTDLAAYTDLRRKAALSHSVHHSHTTEASCTAKLPARYEVLEKVGQGGVGIVYKARDLETGEVLALKVLKTEAASDPVVQANFNKELCLARKITHRNVCRIYDLYRNDGIAYASMEYIEGETLLKVLNREGKLQIGKTLEILRQMCAGLREAHAQGVVHRDLKPANVMVDRNGIIKIMDFGIARLMQTDVSHTAAIVGTPAYMSPEQAEGKPVDARADIYALGLIFYEMITGTAAFSGDTSVTIALKQVTEAPRSPRDLVPTLPRHIETVILKCLEKKPSRRFQSVMELEDILENIEHATERPRQISTRQGMKKASLNLAHQVEQYVGNLRVGAAWDRWAAIVSRALAVKVPTHFSFFDRRTEATRVLIFGSLLLLAPIMGWAVFGHSNKTFIASSGKSLHSIPIAANVPASQTTKPAGITPGPAAHEIPFIALDSNLSTTPASEAELDDDSASEADAPSQPVHRHAEKLRLRSATKPGQLHSSSKPVQPALPLSSTALAPSSTAPLKASAQGQTPESMNVPQAGTALSNTASVQGAEESGSVEKYFDVGNFKDAAWADEATETLKKLGFDTVVLHKGHLWMNSYHVIVGPYRTDDEAETARQNLESDGFKPRLTK
ncbi:MAG TPA: protein kinase [Candidatus Acidoferrales bacterium]|nr:protein kinase [Candidatus Acidoferrales bacterium]